MGKILSKYGGKYIQKGKAERKFAKRMGEHIGKKGSYIL